MPHTTSSLAGLTAGIIVALATLAIPSEASPDGHHLRAVPPGVCALGVSLGRWGTDSPAASICRQVYGS